MAQTIAIIGGTGLTELPGFSVTHVHDVVTEYGLPSSSVLEGQLGDSRVLFLARHGHPHSIPPHKVNYRANIAALAQLGASNVLAVNAVGGISKNMAVGTLVMPKQIIDYTHGRESTFFDGEDSGVRHVDFTEPYAESMRHQALNAAQKAGEKVIDGGVYGVTQGPRLETIAEIFRMENDGCDLVGMTGMPEASLAREKQLNYASLCLVVNPAAGKGIGPITLKDIQQNVSKGIARVRHILEHVVTENVD